MRVGLGEDGARHAILLLLVRMREAAGQSRPQDGFRPLDEIYEETVAWRGLSTTDCGRLLEDLVVDGVAEPDDSCRSWRATDLAVLAIGEAYATRHPLL